MNMLVCKGSDGYRPSGFLAALGLAKILKAKDINIRMRWIFDHDGSGALPQYTIPEEGDIKNTSMYIAGIINSAEKPIRLTEGKSIRSQEFGIAHLGQKIGVPGKVFRAQAELALQVWFEGILQNKFHQESLETWVASFLSASACDAIIDQKKDEVHPTPYSFSNGSGAQLLLKDFRSCARSVTAERVSGYLTGNDYDGFRVREGVTSLNWDPSEQIGYAVRWGDPGDSSKNKASVNVVENALAYIGLSFLTVIPGNNKLGAVGWRSRKGFRGFVWPLWQYPLSIDLIKSLMASSDQVLSEYLGVLQVRFSRVYNPDGKRNYFAPSVLL